MYSKLLTKPLVTEAMKQGARYIILMTLCLLLRPGVAEAVKVEFDAESSTSIADVSLNASLIVWNPSIPGPEPGYEFEDLDSWSGSGKQYEGSSEVSLGGVSFGPCTASVEATVSASGVSYNAYPELGEQSIEGQTLHEIRFYVDASTWPCPPLPQIPNSPFILTGYDCELSAAGEIVWDLLPSTEDEEIGTPVVVSFGRGPIGYSLGGLSGGTVYEFRIFDWSYGIIERGMEGPYGIRNYADPPDYGSDPSPIWQNLDIHAFIGDKIILYYMMEGEAHPQDDLVPSNLTPDGEHPTMGLSVAVWVEVSGATVEISEEPDFVVLYQPTEDSPTETLTAHGNPPGGEYEWQIIQGQNRAKIGKYGKSTKIKGLTPSTERNDVIVKVTYCSPDGKTAEAFKTFTVKRPSAVSISNFVERDVSKPYLYLVEYTMQVSDQFGDPIEKKGIPWDEWRTRACTEYPEILKGRPGPEDYAETDKDGRFPDFLYLKEADVKKELFEGVRKVNQTFWIGGYELFEEGQFCQHYYKDYAFSLPGECPCP